MKKFSKKLFCLMLVAIMVATAIPFGAFADEPFKHSVAGGTEEFHSEGNAQWVWGGNVGDATGHVEYCAKCYEKNNSRFNTRVVPHDFDSATHACKTCGYTHGADDTLM